MRPLAATALLALTALLPAALPSRAPTARFDQASTPPSSAHATATASFTLVRRPWIQQVGADSAYVAWRSREAGPASVRYSCGGATRTVPAATRFRPASETGLSVSFYQHEAHLTGLTASSSCSYTALVNGRGASGANRTFTTAPHPGTGTARFIVFGDSGTGSSAQRRLAAVMAKETFDFALHTGDVVYGNSGGTGDANYRQMEAWFFDIYAAWLGRRPIFPVMGNHDDRIHAGRPYRDAFVLPRNGASSAFPEHAERFYSFDYGPVHVVALETERVFAAPRRRAAQLAWLDADLAATSAAWKIAVLHRPPFSSGAEHGSNLAVRAAFAPIFERRGVQVVFAGHDHDYERTVPVRTGSSGHAPMYVVTGGGGGPLYSVGRNAWTATSRSFVHFVRVRVSGCTLSMVAVDDTGGTRDPFTLDRCAQARDRSRPSVAITNPMVGDRLSGTVTVDIAGSDDQRIVKIALLVDGRGAGKDISVPYRIPWNTRTAGNGRHRLEARAYDIAGRVTTSTPVEVSVLN